MADVVRAVVGVAVLAVVVSDLTSTAIAPSLHGGWLTRRVGIRLWGWLRTVVGRRGRALQFGGLLLTVGLVLTWIAGLLVGWTLVVDPLAGLEHTPSGRPTGFGDVVYFVGYSLSTMGNGDIAPTTGVGQALTVLVSLSGLLALTLAITYLVPVLQSAADRRVLAARIHALGPSPETIAARLWPDGRTSTCDDVVRRLASDISDTTQAHSSYPVLHFFHARNRNVALAPNVAALDEALASVLGEDPSDAPVPELLLHTAIGECLDALLASFVHDRVEEVPRPSSLTDHLEEARRERRCRLAAWVIDDGWTWDDAIAPGRT